MGKVLGSVEKNGSNTETIRCTNKINYYEAEQKMSDDWGLKPGAPKVYVFTHYF